jgi:ComF family protein
VKIRIINSLLDVLYPPICKVCNAALFDNEVDICLKCIKDMPLARLEYANDNDADRLFWGIVEFEKVLSFMNYSKGSPYTHLLLSLKYRGDKKMGLKLGRLMAKQLPKVFFERIDYIIPVPLHSSKLKIRGYNQAEWLAKGIQMVYPIPILGDALIKTQATPSQTTRGVLERRSSTPHLFTCNPLYELAGKHVLLLDDVLTTGATLIACREALLGVEHLRVSALTFAISKS